MHTIIENNRSKLRYFGRTSRVLGWATLLATTVWVLSLVWVLLEDSQMLFPEYYRNLIDRHNPLKAVFIAILALGLSQFSRYLLGIDQKPGWILHHGGVLLYLYVLSTLFLGRIIDHVPIPGIDPSTFGISGGISGFEILHSGVRISVLIIWAAKIIVLFGLAELLRRILPIIEESRTLA